jgi:pyruvate dehydrogenase E1 component
LKVHLLASGPLVQQAAEAQLMLQERGIATDLWSVTSYNELYRDAVAAERWNRLHPGEKPRTPYLCRAMEGERGVFVAVSDYVKAYANSIAPWLPGRCFALGTDGYGRSESRPVLRDYFEIDARHMVVTALHGLALEGELEMDAAAQAMRMFGIDPAKVAPSEV